MFRSFILKVRLPSFNTGLNQILCEINISEGISLYGLLRGSLSQLVSLETLARRCLQQKWWQQEPQQLQERSSSRFFPFPQRHSWWAGQQSCQWSHTTGTAKLKLLDTLGEPSHQHRLSLTARPRQFWALLSWKVRLLKTTVINISGDDSWVISLLCVLLSRKSTGASMFSPMNNKQWRLHSTHACAAQKKQEGKLVDDLQHWSLLRTHDNQHHTTCPVCQAQWASNAQQLRLSLI